MPKIALRYKGSDEAMLRKLKASDGVVHVESVDAREILAAEGTEYEYVGPVAAPASAPKQVMTTSGKPMPKEPLPDGKRVSDGMTVDDMKDALKKAGVQFPSDAKKAELAELVDRNLELEKKD